MSAAVSVECARVNQKKIGAIRIVFIPIHDQNPLKIIPFQRVTLGIILACVATFLLEWSLPPAEASSLLKSFALVPAVLLGPPDAATGLIPTGLTLVTSAFLHGSWPHLIGNMLLLFGDNVEDPMGHLCFLLFYLLCGVAASLAHAVAMPDSTLPLVGASGAVSGVLGAYLMLHPRVKILVVVLRWFPLVLPAYLLIGGWLLFQLYNLWSAGDALIAWWAHLGGFAAGAVLIVPFRYKQVPLFDRGSPH